MQSPSSSSEQPSKTVQLNTDKTFNIGELAPSFSLQDQYNKNHQLTDYAGQWIVLYFYPRDATPICTNQACALKDNNNAFLSKQAVILGVSADSVEKHQQFAQQNQLPFSLLSDPQGGVAKKYGALFDLKWLRFVKRHSFIIDPQGRIAKIYRNVNAEQHAQTILDDLQRLQTSD